MHKLAFALSRSGELSELSEAHRWAGWARRAGEKLLLVCDVGGTMEPTQNLKNGRQSRSLTAAFMLYRNGFKVRPRPPSVGPQAWGMEFARGCRSSTTRVLLVPYFGAVDGFEYDVRVGLPPS